MQQNWWRVIHRRGLVSEPNGLGDPTPTDSTSGRPVFPVSLRIWVKLFFFIRVDSRLAFSFRVSRITFHAATCRPSGALVIWGVPRAIYMPPRWGCVSWCLELMNICLNHGLTRI